MRHDQPSPRNTVNSLEREVRDRYALSAMGAFE
jgi:hypothetical protein